MNKCFCLPAVQSNTFKLVIKMVINVTNIEY